MKPLIEIVLFIVERSDEGDVAFCELFIVRSVLEALGLSRISGETEITHVFKPPEPQLLCKPRVKNIGAVGLIHQCEGEKLHEGTVIEEGYIGNISFLTALGEGRKIIVGKGKINFLVIAEKVKTFSEA